MLYDSWTCTRSLYVNYLKNHLKTFIFFRENVFSFMTGIFKYEAKTQKQTSFRLSLFGNYYSTLNYLSNGIKYLYFFLVLKFFEKNSKNF